MSCVLDKLPHFYFVVFVQNIKIKIKIRSRRPNNSRAYRTQTIEIGPERRAST